jgi:hypothetical protein
VIEDVGLRVFDVLKYLTHRAKRVGLHDEDVAEDDGGVDEIGIAFNGLEGECRGDLWGAAAGEEVMRPFGMVVFGEVAARWEVCQDRIGSEWDGE